MSGQVGAANQFRARGDSASEATEYIIIANGSNFDLTTTGTEAKIIVASGANFELGATSGTRAARMIQVGTNIQFTEI